MPMDETGDTCPMDKRTFTELVKLNERKLYCVAMSYTGNAPDAADAVQETLLRAWSKRHTLREERLFSTWLMRILINECKTLLRKRKRSLPMADVPANGLLPPPDADDELFAALFSLPEKYRVPLVLTALQGCTLAEAAAMLRMPLNTVKTRVSRARKILKQEVADNAE